MSEAIQRRVIQKLLPLKSRLEELINKGVLILATGNAGEVFCKEIAYITEQITTEGLGIFNCSVKTDLFDRFNGKVLGSYEDIKVVGFRSQFSMIYGDNQDGYFVSCDRGIGINKNSKLEGLRKNNLICTQILGPILPLNPLLCEKLLALCGVETEAAYRESAIAAYEQRLKELCDPNVPC
jgi:CobQ-like glutamine amidotransferase family enzyme